MRWEALHPGRLIAYEWIPLPSDIESGSLDPVVWYANCLEELEAGHHPNAGPDGIIRLSD